MTATASPRPDLSAVINGTDYRIARYVLKRMGILPARSDFHDALQVARLALVRAAREFDATRGVRFNAWACRCVRHAVKLWVRRNVRAGFRWVPTNFAGVADDHPERLTGNVTDREANPAEQAEAREAWGYLANLDQRARSVMALRFDGGLSFKEIGSRLGFTRQTAVNVFRAALAKLRDLLSVGHDEIAPPRPRVADSAARQRYRRNSRRMVCR